MMDVVIKKGTPMANVNPEDKVKDWYLSMRCLGMLMNLNHNWWGLDCDIFPRKEPSSLLKTYSSAFASPRYMGHSIMPLFFISFLVLGGGSPDDMMYLTQYLRL